MSCHIRQYKGVKLKAIDLFTCFNYMTCKYYFVENLNVLTKILCFPPKNINFCLITICVESLKCDLGDKKF